METCSAATDGSSLESDCTNMSNLRIVLLGKNESENSKLGNIILDTTAFHKEAPSYLEQHSVRIGGKVEKRHITVINTHLLQPNLSQQQLIQAVSECVYQSAPGPHVFVLVLQYKDFTENDRKRVKTVLNLFSEQAIKHTILLTTDEESRAFFWSSRNNAIHDLIEECGGGHLEFDTGNPGWRSELFRRTEEMLKKECEEFLICNMCEDEGGSLVDGDLRRSGDSVRDDNKEKEDSDLKESTKTGRDGGETLLKAPMEKLRKSLQMWFWSQDSRERENELRIVLLGKTGVGKSSTGNTILGRKVFISDISEKSVTKVCQKKTAEINSRHITVIDTPGLFDTEVSNEEIQREIGNCIHMILPGPHVFIIVINLAQRFTQEEKTSVKIIQETFGENALKYTMVLFTRGDDLNDKTIEQYLGNPGSVLKILIDECGNRFHVFNNKETADRTQVTDLLQKIDNMVKENGGSYYSCKMFREKERELQEKQKNTLMEKVEQVIREREELMNKHGEEKKKMKMKIEEERQNHERERKRREDEFIKKEEQYKRVIQEREEQERKIRNELKREREEWEKQKQLERKRREEEEEKWRKKEQEKREEYNQRLKQEKERTEREKEDLQSKHEKEEKRMKTMIDEERQTHDNERKRREEEFREKEERYKTEMKTEREEWERQKQEAIQKRDEEENRRRKIEQETWDEYYQKIKQEKKRREREREELQFQDEKERKRMKKRMEEERQNHDKVRKRRKDEYLEREEQYKRDIESIEEQERNIREELKSEREEWEKQKQQERQREEEEAEEAERCIFNELYTETSEDDEDSSSDSGCLRILLFGRTGSGKSATGNTILGSDEFHSEPRSELVTTVCKKGVGEVDGRSVAVIDTPGLFDTTLTKEQVQEEIMKCISLSAPGPHVFIIVLSVGRITQGEKDTLDMIKMSFGPKAADFCIVLFTRGDELKGQAIKQYVEKNKDAELKKLISECGNRFLAFNNTETQDQTQVTDLLEMIEEMNQGQYYTNELFEEADISTEQFRKMIKENKTKNLAKLEKLKANYDTVFESMRKRLKEKKQRTDEEREKLKNKFREKEETLRREFEEKEESEQEKRETEDQKRSEEEEQQRAEYDQSIEEMKREIEDQRKQNEEQLKEKEEEEDRMRDDEYKQNQEKMKNDHEHIMAELRIKQEEETKKRDSEEQMRKTQEEKEREEWKRKIKEAENDKETRERIKRQMREWEEEKKRQMREREEEERERKERHEKQLSEKQEELEKMREKFESERKEDEQMREKQKRDREQKKREYEERINEMKRHYEQLERERKEEWRRTKREDEERRVEKRKRWKKMMEDIKREQEEEIKRREREETERLYRKEKECDKMKQKVEEEIEKIKKNHEDTAKRQREELNYFRKRKKKHIQELKERLEEFQKQLNEVKKEREGRSSCHVM